MSVVRKAKTLVFSSAVVKPADPAVSKTCRHVCLTEGLVRSESLHNRSLVRQL